MALPVQCEMCARPIDLANEQAPKLCIDCAKRTKLPYPLPSRRGAHPCMRCGGRVLIRAQVREHSATPGSDLGGRDAVPLAITYATGERFKATFSLEMIPSADPNLEAAFGMLDAYVCRACGFVEWYAQEPEKIPIGAAYGTQLIELPDSGAFR